MLCALTIIGIMGYFYGAGGIFGGLVPKCGCFEVYLHKKVTPGGSLFCAKIALYRFCIFTV